MITPFFGLSTLVHLFLIIAYRIFKLKNYHNLSINKYRSIKKFLGFVIIFSMFSFIFVSAVFMISASINEKHSSINLMADYISSYESSRS